MMRNLAIAIALVVSACGHKTRWGTTTGEDGMMLVQEYHPQGVRDLSWVLRIDMSKVNAGSYSQRWTDDDLDLQLGTANGVVHGKMTCTPAPDTFTCDGHALDAKAGRVITYSIDALGHFGAPVQSDLGAYKRL